MFQSVTQNASCFDSNTGLNSGLYASSAAVAMQISRKPEPRRSMRFIQLNTSAMMGLRLSLFTRVATTSSGSGSPILAPGE